MSSSEAARLIATADAATEIFVVDHSFQLITRGLGNVDVQLPPGLYKVKFRAGTRIQQQFVALESGATARVNSPTLAFSSSAPLNGTLRTHEYHMGAAHGLSRDVRWNLGSGSEIFVFSRVWTDQSQSIGPSPPAGYDPAVSLTLHDLGGNLLIDFAQDAPRDLANDPWAGGNARVDPGNYRLRVRCPDGPILEQCVVASPNWQTQVFLLQTNYGDSASPFFAPDLANGSILMTRPGYGFDPDRTDFRLAEAARVALACRRAVMPRDLLQMFQGKFEDPMLGIYAAHAQIAAGRVEGADLRLVVDNLLQLIPSHPDVNALLLYLDGPARYDATTYTAPPMLADSWSIVAKHAARNREIVTADSLAARVAAHLWGSGVWLIWLADAVEERVPDPPPLDVSIAQLADIRAAVELDLSRAKETPGLNDLEAGVLASVTRRRRVMTQTRAFNAPPDSPPQAPAHPAEMVQQLATALGVPLVTAQAAIATLMGKLGRQ